MFKNLLERALKKNGICLKDLATNAKMEETKLIKFLDNKEKISIEELNRLLEAALGENELVIISESEFGHALIFQHGKNNNATIILNEFNAGIDKLLVLEDELNISGQLKKIRKTLKKEISKIESKKIDKTSTS
jgi:hypothetical protein